MITEQDLQAAIAECEGQRNPTANTCMKLAAFYTIRDKMFADDKNEPVKLVYSTASAPSVSKSNYSSDTEFMRIAGDMSEYRLLEVMDEIMTALSVLNPQLYQAAIRKMLEN